MNNKIGKINNLGKKEHEPKVYLVFDFFTF